MYLLPLDVCIRTSIVICILSACIECVRFTRLHGLVGTIVNCSQDNDGEKSCSVSCRGGMMPTSKFANPYHCGPTTNYVWSHLINNPNAHLPMCTSKYDLNVFVFEKVFIFTHIHTHQMHTHIHMNIILHPPTHPLTIPPLPYTRRYIVSEHMQSHKNSVVKVNYPFKWLRERRQ